jgi:hypothetical protein
LTCLGEFEKEIVLIDFLSRKKKKKTKKNNNNNKKRPSSVLIANHSLCALWCNTQHCLQQTSNMQISCSMVQTYTTPIQLVIVFLFEGFRIVKVGVEWGESRGGFNLFLSLQKRGEEGRGGKRVKSCYQCMNPLLPSPLSSILIMRTAHITNNGFVCD